MVSRRLTDPVFGLGKGLVAAIRADLDTGMAGRDFGARAGCGASPCTRSMRATWDGDHRCSTCRATPAGRR